ncbi:MAG TPA: hypothetical protein DD435_04470 [Cyanobacteria bacterium UBA8530]|nr:hypothetical protein [Cyanobacteria bacterium UBA8530]
MKAKLLVICSREIPFPLIAGFGLRIFHAAKQLSSIYDVDLLFMSRGKVEPESVRMLKSVFRNVFCFPYPRYRYLANATKGIFCKEPIQVHYYTFEEVRRWLMANQGDYQAILANHIRVVEMLHGLSVPVALDLHDAISLNYERAIPNVRGPWRWLYSLERDRLLKYEVESINKLSRSFVVSEVDRQHLISHGADPARILTVPLAVPDAAFERLPYEGAQNDSIVFLGKMSYHPNKDAASFLVREVLPLVRREVPNCRVSIVGAEPPREIQELANTPGVEVTGFVEDPYLYLEKAKVFAAPLRFGAGVQTKVLEGMALRKAIVTSGITAAGIGGRDGSEFLIADGAERTAAAIIRLLKESSLRESLGQGARKWIEDNFTWKKVGQCFLDELSSLEGEKQRHPA